MPTSTSSKVSFGLRVVCVALALPAAACSNPLANNDCSTLGVAGITATVVDARTNKAPSATASVQIEDGAFSEAYSAPIPQSDPPRYSGAIERTGIYRLTVRAAGYKDFVVDSVVVTRSGRCQYLQGAQLTIPLIAN